MNTFLPRLLTGIAGAATIALASATPAVADPGVPPAPATAPPAAAFPGADESTDPADPGVARRPDTAAPQLLPPINYTMNLLGFDFKHTNQFPAGVSLDGGVWAVNPDWNIFTIGWLAHLAPFDVHCATGTLDFETKSGQWEVHPLANQCSFGYIYGILSDRPARDYRMVCLSSATEGDRGQRTCFRFIN